jgi:hypothetical protein
MVKNLVQSAVAFFLKLKNALSLAMWVLK